MKIKKLRKGRVFLAGVLTAAALLYPDMVWGDGKGAGENTSLVQAEETQQQRENPAEEEKEVHLLEVPEAVSAAKSEGLHAMQEFTLGKEKASAVIPVKVNISGSILFWLNLKDETEISGGNVQYALFEDKECTKKVKLEKQKNAETGKCQADSVAAVDPGEYYLKVSLSKDAKLLQDEISIEAGGIAIPEQAELVSGEWRGIANVRTRKKAYYKLAVTEDSQVKLQIENLADNGKISLCDENKKALSKETALFNGKTKVTYTVGKGLYYVCVNTEAPYVRAKLSTSRVQKSSGTSRKKAELLKVGKAAKKYAFTLNESEKKEHWYYFKNTSKNKIEVHFKGEVQGGEFRLEFFRGKTSFGTVSLTESNKDASFSPTSGVMGTETLPAGTYHMKVVKSSQKVSGCYQLQVIIPAVK